MTVAEATPALDLADRDDRAFLGHPKGLGYLGFTEACERFSYYSMQTLLVLYMVNYLLVPGRMDGVIGLNWLRGVHYQGLNAQPLASAIFGDYADVLDMKNRTLSEAYFNTSSTIENNPYHFAKVEAEKEAWRMAADSSSRAAWVSPSSRAVSIATAALAARDTSSEPSRHASVSSKRDWASPYCRGSRRRPPAIRSFTPSG